MSTATLRTTVELRDLGAVRPEWSGILSPMYADEQVHKYIHDQFLDSAAQYVERYQNTNYQSHLHQNAQRQLPDPTPKMILDIGSGAGNTIFALLELYPTASIIASDLSVPLLSVVRDIRDTSYANRDCLIMQLTEDLVFEENQFDLVVGGAILHHLFDPRLTLEQCHKVLKPNGAAVFFEPFELGYQTIGLTLKHLLAMNAGRPENKQLDPRVAEFFRALAFDFDVRNGADKSAEIYTRIDDKWLFTRDYFEALSQSIGFRDVTITPLHGTVQQFGRQIDTFLRIGLQSTLSSLPQQALDQIALVDDHFSEDARRDLIIEGCIILKK